MNIYKEFNALIRVCKHRKYHEGDVVDWYTCNRKNGIDCNTSNCTFFPAFTTMCEDYMDEVQELRDEMKAGV